MSRVPPIGLRISSRTQDVPFLGISQYYYYDQFKQNLVLNRIVGKFRMLKLFSLLTKCEKKSGTRVIFQPEFLPISTLLKAKQYFSLQLLQSKYFFKTKTLGAFNSRFILLGGSNSIALRTSRHVCCYYFIKQNFDTHLCAFCQMLKSKGQYIPPICRVTKNLFKRKVKLGYISNIPDSSNFCPFCPKQACPYGGSEKKIFSHNDQGSIFMYSSKQRPTRADSVLIKVDPKISFELLQNFCSQSLTLNYEKNINQNQAGPGHPKVFKQNKQRITQNNLSVMHSSTTRLPLPGRVFDESDIFSKRKGMAKKDGYVILASYHILNKGGLGCKLLQTYLKQKQNTIFRSKKDKSNMVVGNLQSETTRKAQIIRGAPAPKAPFRAGRGPRFKASSAVEVGEQGPSNLTPAKPSFVSNNCSYFKLTEIFSSNAAGPSAPGQKVKQDSVKYAVQSIFLLACLQQLSNSTNSLVDLLTTCPIPLAGVFRTQWDAVLPCYKGQNSKQKIENPDHGKAPATKYAVPRRRSAAQAQVEGGAGRRQQAEKKRSTEGHRAAAADAGLGVEDASDKKIAAPHFIDGSRILYEETSNKIISNLTHFPLPNSLVSKISNSFVLNRTTPTYVCEIKKSAEEKKSFNAQFKHGIRRPATKYAVPRAKHSSEGALRRSTPRRRHMQAQAAGAGEKASLFKQKTDYSEKLFLTMKSAFLVNSRYTQYASEDLPKFAISKKSNIKKKNYRQGSATKYAVLSAQAQGGYVEQRQLQMVKEQAGSAKLGNLNEAQITPKLLIHRAFASPTELHLFGLIDSLVGNSRFNPANNRGFFARPWKGCLTLYKYTTPSRVRVSTPPFKKQNRPMQAVAACIGGGARIIKHKGRVLAHSNKQSRQPEALSDLNDHGFTATGSDPYLHVSKMLVSKRRAYFIENRSIIAAPAFRFCPERWGLCRVKAAVVFDLIYPSQIVQEYNNNLKDNKDLALQLLKNSDSIILKKFISIRL